MMGFPCLRLQGDFFASFDRQTGSLVVKLDEARVEELLATGQAEPFAPNGRRFRAWASVPSTQRKTWPRHLDAALAAAIARIDANL